MNWNKNNNDNNPWGTGGNNNPWGSGGNGSNRSDFEDSIKKAKDRFGKFKFGGRRNISFFIIIAILLWLATGFYRVEPDEQGVELLLVNGTGKQQSQVFTIFSYSNWSNHYTKSGSYKKDKRWL